jgi:DNA-binding NarL/FixJ family response regulator
MRSKIIEILIAEDEELVRLGIAAKLEQLDLFDFNLNFVTNGEDAILFMRKNIVDILLLDIRMDKCDGFTTLSIMRNLQIEVPVVVISATNNISEIKTVFKLGAKAFIQKNRDNDKIGFAILSVLNGDEFQSSSLKEQIFVPPKRVISTEREIFTEKEMLILSHLLNGMTSKEIANYMYLSPRTVEGHRARLMRKAGTKSLLELAKFVNNNSIKLVGKVEVSTVER